ncbi:hypothetical protein [Methanosarcina sp. DH2]|jgi:hypothetical protein|nr:hypothetical protein [Methanosarcina sp. DH2]
MHHDRKIKKDGLKGNLKLKTGCDVSRATMTNGYRRVSCLKL